MRHVRTIPFSLTCASRPALVLVRRTACFVAYRRSSLLQSFSLLHERSVGYRDALKTKTYQMPQKKHSLVAPQKLPENTPLKNKEKTIKEKKEIGIDVGVKEENESQVKLDDLMKRVLDEELQNIMIEVWQALPDEPPTEVERFVAEKLRNEASDDLRNVLGLNATKRLLNVFNPLLVKIHFSRRPEKGCLTKFLETYNIKSFKRITKETNTFAARFTSITDFDNICAAKNINCGGARITVSPYYNYAQCPKKLNSIFADNDKEAGVTGNDEKGINTVLGEKLPDASKEKDKTAESNASEEKQADVTKEKQHKVVVSQTKETTNAQKKVTTEKITPNDNIKQTEAVLSKTNVSDNKPQSEELNKMSIVKPNTSDKNIKITDAVTQVKSAKRSKDTDEIKIPIAKFKTPLKQSKIGVLKKANKIKRPVAKPAQKSVPTKEDKLLSERSITEIKRSLMLDEFNDLDDTEMDYQCDDGDEMNDEEILALISSGVIVDQGAASDKD